MASSRPLSAADKAAWRGLWRGCLTFYQTEKPEAVVQATFARLPSPDPAGFRGLVAEDAAWRQRGRLVGLVHQLFLRSTRPVQNTCYPQDLYADPTVRGQVIGRALIAAVHESADAADIAGVCWFTAQDNRTARQLQDRIAVKTRYIRYRRR